MLQPLRVASAPPAPTLAPETPVPTRSAALARVCAVEAVLCKRKTKHDGASCYVIDTYQYNQPQRPPASQHAMLSPEWTADTQTMTTQRAPDATVARPFLAMWALARALANVGASCQLQSYAGRTCRLCHNVVAYVALMDRGTNALRRVVLTPILKQREIQELVGTFVAIVVRAQHAPARHAVHEPNCANEDALAALLVEFLGLQ